MSIEDDNKALVRRHYQEVINNRRIDLIDELFAEDYIHPHPEFPPGREGVKQFEALFPRAFPDVHITIDDIVAEGDRVVVRATARGTHKSEFMGIAPTGNQVTIRSIEVFRIANGKLAQNWDMLDMYGLLQQLGVVE